ncbi:MAG: GNAT family N-acetyltransferase [Bacteroidota bacterium]
MPTTIRPATLDDVPAMHGLVGELASFVDALPAFTATVEEYQKDFAEDWFRGLVAEVDGKVIGMALYVLVYSTWKGRMIYLEDFVLQPAYRRQGIGQQLWDALLEVGRAEGCHLLKWQVINTNDGGLKFYAAQEAIIEDDWLNGKLFL